MARPAVLPTMTDAERAAPAGRPASAARQALARTLRDLREAECRAEAARARLGKCGADDAALAGARQAIAAADAQAGEARARIRPAVAAVLREDAAWMAAEYWRRWADLEQVRRELSALDQLLIADFPIVHAPTGRTMIDWVSPDRLSAPAQLEAAEAACAGLDTMADLIGSWRSQADDLARS